MTERAPENLFREEREISTPYIGKMVSANWISSGLQGGCASDWVDEEEDAAEAALKTRFYFRRLCRRAQ